MAKKKAHPATKKVVPNNEVTSDRVASIASKKLKDKNSDKDVRSIAGTALTQAKNKPKPIIKKQEVKK